MGTDARRRANRPDPAARGTLLAVPPPASPSPKTRPDGAGGLATLLDEPSEQSPEFEESWLPRGETLGRYVILERIGAGGMGVVYSAYDRDLDRRVAIKLLHSKRGPGKSKGQARLLREAQAMARLAHPNVVAVHEASTYQRHLFIAMEFIDGQTLGAWLEQERRSWREVVEVMRQAGRGLAAAHHQELIHRDFKPDNILVGRDGRARVLDFGLARSLGEQTRDEIPLDELVRSRDSVATRLTETGALAGTPAYMAPEQYRGQSPDARTDQFSFCVTLWEALYGERPFRGDNRAQLAMAVCRGEIRDPPSGPDVPAFLRRVMRRGLSLDRSERFESMDAMLAALEADPGRTRKRVLAGAMAALGIATLSAAAARWSSGGGDPCAGGQDRLAAVFGEPQRAAIDQAFSQVDAQFAVTSLETVQRELDAYSVRWLESYRDACEATHVRHEQSNDLLDRRMSCLGQRLGSLEATATLLAQADRDAIAHSIRAATSLPSVQDCSDAERLMAASAPPADAEQAEQVEQLRAGLARAVALGMTGQAEKGLQEVRDAVEHAEALDYPPLLAELALSEGELAYMAGHPHEALPRLETAVEEAIAIGHDEVLLRATSRLISLVGVSLSRYEDAERWGRLARAANRRRGRDVDDTISLNSSLCMMLADKGDSAAGLPYCEEALELSVEHYGPEHATTGLSYRALGNAHYAAGDYPAASEAYERSTELFLDSHGIDHPEYPALLNSLAAVCFSQKRGEECVDLFRQSVAAAVVSYGPEHPAVADFTNNLATVLLAEGRLDEAETHARRSLELRRARFGDDHPGVGAAHRVLARIAGQRDDLPGGLHHADRAVSILRATRGEIHPDVLAAIDGRANIRLAAGKIDEGIADREEALRLVTALKRPPLQQAQQRFALAQALAEHRPAQRGRAQALADEARAQAGDEALIAEIDQWHAEQGTPSSRM